MSRGEISWRQYPEHFLVTKGRAAYLRGTKMKIYMYKHTNILSTLASIYSFENIACQCSDTTKKKKKEKHPQEPINIILDNVSPEASISEP